MRVIDTAGKTLTQYDVTAGTLISVKAIREDALPIDNCKKFAWAQEDYEDALMYIPHRILTPAQQIQNLKEQLASTDYRVLKCSECQLLGQAMPYDVAELFAQRQALRDQINRLEQGEAE